MHYKLHISVILQLFLSKSTLFKSAAEKILFLQPQNCALKGLGWVIASLNNNTYNTLKQTGNS